ncbi:MAG: DUF2812 domain-containing protein [Bacteroidales bacterium]|nr:DUF2812 domain-containing protein [Bacteroidales bacterium]
MKNDRIAINWFVDFDKEEQWINEMSKKGWRFWHTNGVIYRFKKCEPGEFIYQIDFDEKQREGGEDYVVFRSSCGDIFVHQCKHKIYWKRKCVDGEFEAENNVAAKLRLTNKAFNFHLNSFIGLTIIAAIAYLILMPLGRYLPENGVTSWLTDFSCGLTYGIILSQMVIILPVLRKLRKKMNQMVEQIF